MAIEQGLAAAWALKVVEDYLDSHTIKMALYDSTASLSPDTTAYTATGEISGSGYTAGGMEMTLADGTPKLDGRAVVLAWESVVWPALTASDIRAALIYASTDSNRAIGVIDFGGPVSVNNAPFIVPSPTADANSALIRAIASGQ